MHVPTILSSESRRAASKAVKVVSKRLVISWCMGRWLQGRENRKGEIAKGRVADEGNNHHHQEYYLRRRGTLYVLLYERGAIIAVNGPLMKKEVERLKLCALRKRNNVSPRLSEPHFKEALDQLMPFESSFSTPQPRTTSHHGSLSWSSRRYSGMSIFNPLAKAAQNHLQNHFHPPPVPMLTKLTVCFLTSIQEEGND